MLCVSRVPRFETDVSKSFEPMDPMIVTPGRIAFERVDGQARRVAADLPAGLHHPFRQQVAEPAPPGYQVKHGHDGVVVSPGHLDPVEVPLAQDPFLVTLHEPGDDPPRLIRIHAQAVDLVCYRHGHLRVLDPDERAPGPHRFEFRLFHRPARILPARYPSHLTMARRTGPTRRRAGPQGLPDGV